MVLILTLAVLILLLAIMIIIVYFKWNSIKHGYSRLRNKQNYHSETDNSHHGQTLSEYENGKFIEVSVIGSGGFGTVYKVKHRIDEHIFAIKKVEIKSKYKINSFNKI